VAQKSIVTGVALIALGVIVSLASDSSSVTSMIPAILGVLFVVGGIVARARPSGSHHVMHGAAVVSLLAVLGSLWSAISRGSTGWALFAQLGTALIAGVFLVQAVSSFRTARRTRLADSS
jgi:hypothetical protein